MQITDLLASWNAHFTLSTRSCCSVCVSNQSITRHVRFTFRPHRAEAQLPFCDLILLQNKYFTFNPLPSTKCKWPQKMRTHFLPAISAPVCGRICSAICICICICRLYFVSLATFVLGLASLSRPQRLNNLGVKCVYAAFVWLQRFPRSQSSQFANACGNYEIVVISAYLYYINTPTYSQLSDCCFSQFA